MLDFGILSILLVVALCLCMPLSFTRLHIGTVSCTLLQPSVVGLVATSFACCACMTEGLGPTSASSHSTNDHAPGPLPTRQADPIRVLRAARMAEDLGLTVHPHSEALIRRAAPLVRVSGKFHRGESQRVSG